jgi:hypothetical protein
LVSCARSRKNRPICVETDNMRHTRIQKLCRQHAVTAADVENARNAGRE